MRSPHHRWVVVLITAALVAAGGRLAIAQPRPVAQQQAERFADNILQAAERLEAGSIQRPKASVLVQHATRNLLAETNLVPSDDLRRQMADLEGQPAEKWRPALIAAHLAVGRRLGRDPLAAYRAALEPTFRDLGISASIDRQASEWSTPLLAPSTDIGLKLQADAFGIVRVRTPLPRSVAYQAGLRHGDELLFVETQQHVGPWVRQSVEPGTPVAQVANLFLGARENPVALVWRVQHTGELKSAWLTRRDRSKEEPWLGFERRPDGATNYLLDPASRIGYLRPNSKIGDAAKLWREIAAKGQLRGIILDLRGCPPCYLSSAFDLADDLLPKGLFTKLRTLAKSDEWRIQQPARFPDLKVALLIDETTTQGWEVLAACLQDRQRAAVIGTRSAGQVAIEKTCAIGGEFDLTFAESVLERPSGRNLAKLLIQDPANELWGVEPDPGLKLPLLPTERQYLHEYLRHLEYFHHPHGRPAWMEHFRDRQRDLALDWLRRELDKEAATKSGGRQPADPK